VRLPMTIIKKIKENGAQNKKLVLLDAHAILHRAYHALPDFASSKGVPTGALYGLSAMLIKIIDELKPDYLVACYDLPGPTYRHEAYKEYKAGRKKADDALVAQMKSSRDVFAAFNIPIYEMPGFEADDMLGTIVEVMKNKDDIDIVIASGDMDTLQLVVNNKVQVYTLKKGIKDTILYNQKAVEERFGFKPTLLPDYKGLRGDPSDNIIGITGIGEKTATILIKEFGTIENIYKALKKDKTQFAKVLITPRIIELLSNGEEEALFSKMLGTIRRDAPIDFSLPTLTWKESMSLERVGELFRNLEFRTLGARLGEVINGKKKAEVSPEQASLVMPNEIVNPLELRKISIALWVLDSNHSNPTLDDILFFAKAKSFKEASAVILKEIEQRNLGYVYEQIELPLIPIIKKMEERGIKIDVGYLRELSGEFHTLSLALEKEIWKLAGEEFNINSPKQMGVVLFDHLGIEVKNHKKTSTGVKSTKESELEKMRDLHPIISEILKYRELQKLLGTYIDTIPNQVAEDGRLHTTFLQTGTTTGRMSSEAPNVQNIPTKSEQGKKIRKAFVAEEGFVLAAFDYSQIELRIAAFLSKDEAFLQIFRDGGDVHRAVAAQVFNVPPEKVDGEMRRKAKVINFGILYGMGINALRASLKTTRTEAQEFYNEYFNKFSGLASYLDRVKAEAARKGYTETFFGRRRYFEGIRSSIPFIRAAAERTAINAPIQGTSADIIKIAMIHINEYIIKEKMENNIFLLLQVHDELIFEINKKVYDAVSSRIKGIMEEVLDPSKTGGITCVAQSVKGLRWGDLD
jgi:DNA polymerase-1